VTITIVLPFVNLTGGIRVLLDFANWLHGEGHRVTVVYPSWPYRFHFTRRDQFREWWSKQLLTRPQVGWYDLRCRLRRVPTIANVFLTRADLVLATSWPAVHDVARLDASRGRKVHVLFHHESGTGPEERVSATYALPLHRITFSRVVKNAVEAQFGCEIRQVVPAGIDMSTFFPDGPRASDTVLMLYHNDPRKGAADGIEALTRLRARQPTVRARMCGTVRPAALPPWISFDFHPTCAELRRLYSSSTVFLYPSRYEGFGLPPLEAMACGCPVVTTEVGAVSEFAADRRNALVVQPGDVDGLTDRLEELLRDPALRTELSERGIETAVEYDINRIAPLFRDALRRVLTSV
jgi:glycosyltransferase involved in cell wall biosynthesis